METSERVTVIVPTRNEARNIGAFLASLPPDMGLIVVDDSDDETPELVEALRPANTRLMRMPGNVTQARQIGAESARSEWLLFTDADVTFAPDYFQRLPDCLAADALYGAKLSQDQYQDYYEWFTRGQRMFDRLGIPAASGSNMLIRREVFHAVGGFDLSLYCNEDSEIVWRVRRNGYQVRFMRELVVYARDHRRLERGQVRKTWHSLARSALLFSGLMPEQWRSQDWGYWGQPDREA